VNVPGVPYACVTSGPAAVPPSPKLQLKTTGGDHASEAVAWNVTAWPTTALPPGLTESDGLLGGAPSNGAANTVADSSLKSSPRHAATALPAASASMLPVSKKSLDPTGARSSGEPHVPAARRAEYGAPGVSRSPLVHSASAIPSAVTAARGS
jgi:hypothetical protein